MEVKYTYYISRKTKIIAFGILLTGFIVTGITAFFLKSYFLDRSCENVKCPDGWTCVDTGQGLMCLECTNGDISFVLDKANVTTAICTVHITPTSTTTITSVTTTSNYNVTTITTSTGTTKPPDPAVFVLAPQPLLLNLNTMEYNEDLDFAPLSATMGTPFYSCGMMLNGEYFILRLKEIYRLNYGGCKIEKMPMNIVPAIPISQNECQSYAFKAKHFYWDEDTTEVGFACFSYDDSAESNYKQCYIGFNNDWNGNGTSGNFDWYTYSIASDNCHLSSGIMCPPPSNSPHHGAKLTSYRGDPFVAGGLWHSKTEKLSWTDSNGEKNVEEISGWEYVDDFPEDYRENIFRYAAVSTHDAVYITSHSLSPDDLGDAPWWFQNNVNMYPPRRNFVARYFDDAWDVVGPLFYGPRVYHGSFMISEDEMLVLGGLGEMWLYPNEVIGNDVQDEDYETMFSEIVDLHFYRFNSWDKPDTEYYGPLYPNEKGHTVVRCNTDSVNCQQQSSETGWKRPGKYPKDYLFPIFVGIVDSNFCNKD